METIEKHETLFECIKAFASSKNENPAVNTIVLVGKRGTGRTKLATEAVLSTCCDDSLVSMESYSGDIKAARLFNILNDNSSENKIVVFDNVSSLLADDKSINMISAVADNNDHRVVSSSSAKNDVAFKGKIIIVMDEGESRNSRLSPLLSRAFVLRMKYDKNDILDVAQTVLEELEEENDIDFEVSDILNALMEKDTPTLRDAVKTFELAKLAGIELALETLK